MSQRHSNFQSDCQMNKYMYSQIVESHATQHGAKYTHIHFQDSLKHSQEDKNSQA